jgi:hypothetical protein
VRHLDCGDIVGICLVTCSTTGKENFEDISNRQSLQNNFVRFNFGACIIMVHKCSEFLIGSIYSSEALELTSWALLSLGCYIL